MECEKKKGKALAFDLTSLCPAMVFGPYVIAEAVPQNPAELGESVKTIWDIITAGADANSQSTKAPFD